MCFTTKYSYLLLVILCVLYHWEHSAPRRELHGPSAGCPGRRYGLGSWGLYHAHGLMAWYSASVCPGWGDPCSGALCSHELCRLCGCSTWYFLTLPCLDAQQYILLFYGCARIWEQVDVCVGERLGRVRVGTGWVVLKCDILLCIHISRAAFYIWKVLYK